MSLVSMRHAHGMTVQDASRVSEYCLVVTRVSNITARLVICDNRSPQLACVADK